MNKFIDVNQKVKEISHKDFEQFISEKIKETLLDLDQSWDEAKFINAKNKISSIILEKFSTAFIGEIVKTFENFSTGTCDFAKLTVETFFREFRKNRIIRQEEKKMQVDRYEDSITKSIDKMKTSKAVRAIRIKLDMFNRGKISYNTWDSISIKEILKDDEKYKDYSFLSMKKSSFGRAINFLR